MRGSPYNFPFCALPISTRPNLRFSKPPWYELVTMRISSLRWKKSKRFDALNGVGLRSTLCGITKPSCRAVLWRRRFFACASSCFAIYFFSSKKAGLMHCGFLDLPDWAHASALPKRVFIQFNAPFIFPTESLFYFFCFIRSIFPGGKALWAEEIQTHWNNIFNTGVAALNKCSIDEGTARYTSTTPLLRDYLEEDGAHVWVARISALLNVLLGWIVMLLNLDGSYDDTDWMSCSK